MTETFVPERGEIARMRDLVFDPPIQLKRGDRFGPLLQGAQIIGVVVNGEPFYAQGFAAPVDAEVVEEIEMDLASAEDRIVDRLPAVRSDPYLRESGNLEPVDRWSWNAPPLSHRPPVGRAQFYAYPETRTRPQHEEAQIMLTALVLKHGGEVEITTAEWQEAERLAGQVQAQGKRTYGGKGNIVWIRVKR